jgi:hypothetical protein
MLPVQRVRSRLVFRRFRAPLRWVGGAPIRHLAQTLSREARQWEARVPLPSEPRAILLHLIHSRDIWRRECGEGR